MTELTLYKDPEFKEPFKIEDLGDTDAGDIKTMEGYLYNSTPNFITDISYETLDEDIHIMNVPSRLEPESWKKVEISYTPGEDRRSALNTFVTFRGKQRIPAE